MDDADSTPATPRSPTPIHLRVEPPTHAVAIAGLVAEEDYPTFLGHAYDRLWSAIDLLGASISGASGAQYPTPVPSSESRVEAFVPIAEPVPTFGCADAHTLAQFWSAVTGVPVDQGEPAPSPFFASIGRTNPAAGSLPMMFIQVPEPGL